VPEHLFSRRLNTSDGAWTLSTPIFRGIDCIVKASGLQALFSCRPADWLVSRKLQVGAPRPTLGKYTQRSGMPRDMRSCRDLSRHRHCDHSSIHTGYGHMSVLATGNWVHRQSVYISVLYYRVHRSLSQNHILTQLNPTNTHWLFLICLSIIIPSMPASSKWRIPFTFSDSNFMCVLYVLTCLQFPCSSSSMT
jgi:hypothetical protein